MDEFEAQRRALIKDSGPTGRTIAVLNFLALNAESEYSFADLARQTGISKATLHDIVKVLVANSYLRRAANGRMSLGPAIIGLGEAAVGSQLGVLNVARPVLQDIATDEGLQCIASTVSDDYIVILARYGDRLIRSPWYEVGEQIPFAPPIGTVFLAWGEDADFQRWLDKGGDLQAGFDHEEVRAAVAAGRARGYTFGLRVNARARLQSVLASLEGEESLEEARSRVTGLLLAMEDERYLVPDLEEDRPYDVDFISAPVFDVAGRVGLSINVVGFTRPQSGSDIHRIGRRLRRAAADVTRSSGGQLPSSFPRR